MWNDHRRTEPPPGDLPPTPGRTLLADIEALDPEGRRLVRQLVDRLGDR